MSKSALIPIFTVLMLTSGASPLPIEAQSGQGPKMGPVHEVREAPRRVGKPIDGRFIVTLAPRSDPRGVAREHGVAPDYVYTSVLTGFAGTMSELRRSGLLRDNRVVRIEPDKEAVITATANSWGIDRVDQLSLPLDGAYNPPGSGQGVSVYVVDTGIRFDHAMFGGRAIRGVDVVNDGRNGADCNGHGTHVAGTIGGSSGYGIAPAATLVSARVLNCQGSGTVSGIIAALDWIAANGHRPAVVNMSLGGTASTSLDDAVNSLVASGIPAVVAAGNESTNACNSSPARAANALTVAATSSSDSRASFSNYGSCVDLFAPGVSIISASYSGTTTLAQMSGTSMASPHVAGRAALLLGADAAMTASAVNSAVISTATAVTISGASGSPSRIVYVGSAGTATPPPTTTTPPTGSTIALAAVLRLTSSYPRVVLSWSGATTSTVDVYRNGARVTATPNDGRWAQSLTARGTYRYKVCNAGSTTACSAEASVTY
jgi:subtilisin family serine protease